MPALAQGGPGYRPERPYRGIFGSGVDSLGQALTANASLSAGYDDDLLADATNSSGIQSGQGGKLAQASGGLNYDLTASRASLAAGVGGSVRYYPSLENDFLNMYNAGVRGQVRVLEGRPNLTLSQSVDYTPYSFMSSYSGHVANPFTVTRVQPPNPDFVPLATQYFNAESRADLEARLSRKLSFYSSYAYRVSDRDAANSWYQSGDAGISVEMSRNLDLRLGYRYSEAHYDDGRVVAMHSPDVGLDFNRALSLTRRTSFTFGVGVEATRTNDQAQYHATGNVHLVHEIGRTWTADASYQRGTYYVDTINEPVFADSANAGLHGLITRRIQFSALVTAMLGNSGYSEERDFDSYQGSLSVSTALNRFMSVGADYAYYRYTYDEQILLDPGLPFQMNRQSIRAHVSLWAPLMNRTRRADASR